MGRTFDLDTADLWLQDVIDRHGSGALLRLYTGPRPTPGAAITTEVLLAELALSDPVGAVVGHQLVWGAVTDSVGLDVGDIAWYRTVTAAGDYRTEGTAGTVAGLFDAVVSPTVTVAVGTPIAVILGTDTPQNY